MKFDDIKKLHQKKFREELGYFLVEGEHLVQELQKAALHDPRLRAQRDLCDARVRALAQPAADARDQSHAHGADQRDALAAGHRRGGAAARAAAPRAGERAIYLHEIQDPGNLGTILRTLAWFGEFPLPAEPGQRRPAQRQGGARQHGRHLSRAGRNRCGAGSLRERFERIACLDMQGEPVASPQFREFDCYVFGNEARGLPREQLAALGAQPSRSPAPARSNR